MRLAPPVTLCGRHVRLEPLSGAHHDALCEAVSDGELWQRWYTAIERLGAKLDGVLRSHQLAHPRT